MHDPYTPPQAFVSPVLDGGALTAGGMQWRRILLGGTALFVGLLAWAVAAGFMTPTVAFWLSPDGEWLNVAVHVRKTVYFAVASACYWWFASGLRERRLAHVMLTWLLVQILDATLVMAVMQVWPNQLAWKPRLLEFLPALIGWGLSWLWTKRQQHVRRADP
ncbi:MULTISPECIES: hypothetical protein [unclassified Pseudoxanthomonas]|uniref:hypothetical protein n=1 Tax=unclassified Pseudoxanthomonas TaxID=2645906 RepID=UPI0008F29D45|nr:MULTISPECIES: hypothetical protein [unclassified Pseudoxanthomonas]PPJ43736.1 hypothetical protein C0063_11295 [Pseudoxanthomonas sp. KAs_5_3]SFV36168.1 hypothetical protein SAMN05428990_3336 [Pseudoxanthomonas sp. YR558]